MTNINPNIFRAYDIRGTADPTPEKPNPDLTPDTIKIIGQATATYLIQKYHFQSLAIGCDNRTHSQILQKAFIEGVLSTGLKVTNIGLATSPLTYFASCLPKYDCAINITASHNPKQDNGIKISGKNAAPIANQEIQEILHIIQNNKFLTDPNPNILQEDITIFEQYLKHIKSITNLKRPLKISIDCGNGVAGKFAPQLISEIGGEVIEVNCELDGNFPNHEANPEKEVNLEELKQVVIKNKTNIGLGFDGDGDRIGIIGDNGKFYTAEYILMLLSRDLLSTNPGEKIIFDVKVSNNLIKDIENHGGKPIMSRTGHSFIKARLKKENATLAGEKSGHFFFGKHYYNWFNFDDGLFAACKIIEALSQTSQSFSEIFKELPPLPSLPEFKIYCPDHLKSEIMSKISTHFQKNYDCITIDGVRIKFDHQNWGLIRYSNTSPYFTIFAEADSFEKLTEIKTIIFNHLKTYPDLKFPNTKAVT